MKSDKLRLFLALEIPEKLKAKITALTLPVRSFPVQWVTSKNLHITLKFLGETPLGKKAQIIETLSSIKFKPFSVHIKKGGCFYDSSGHPKVLFLSIENPQINEMAGLIETALLALGFEKESRSFSPHLTLARIKGKLSALKTERFLKLSEKFVSHFKVRSFILYQSILSHQGSVYETVQNFALSD